MDTAHPSLTGKIGTGISGSEALARIAAWGHWEEIGKVAKKEYQISEEDYACFLPEFQRFMALFMCGYQNLGMFSQPVDQIWHSLILATFRYMDFCRQFHDGVIIHHLPQLEPKKFQKCTVCVSCTNCSIKCSGGGDGMTNLPDDELEERRSAEYFVAAYHETFGAYPPVAAWGLPPEVALT